MNYSNFHMRHPGLLFILISSLFVLNGCSTLKLTDAIADAHDPKIVKAFENKINSVAKEIQGDPNYKRIPLDAKEDQEWFVTQAFLYWDNKSSKEEFVNNGINRFPDYRDSFEYLAKRIKK